MLILFLSPWGQPFRTTLKATIQKAITMFKLQPNPTFKVDVTIPVPGGKDGKLSIEFKHKSKKALKEFFDSLTSEENQRTDVEALSDLVAGWSGMDEKFSAENLELFLDNYPSAAMALFEAYRAEVLEARAKN